MTNPFGDVVAQLLKEADGSIPYNLPEESIYLESVRGLRDELNRIQGITTDPDSPEPVVPFSALTGSASRGQLPSEIAYEDEANTFSLRQTIPNLEADEFEALMRFEGG